MTEMALMLLTTNVQQRITSYAHIDFAFVDFVMTPVILVTLTILIRLTDRRTTNVTKPGNQLLEKKPNAYNRRRRSAFQYSITDVYSEADTVQRKLVTKQRGRFLCALHQRTQQSIVVHPTTARAISTDIIRQTIVRHCRTSDLEVEITAACCVKLRLSLSLSLSLSLLSNPDLKIHLFSTAFF